MAESTAALTPTGSLPEGPTVTMTYGRSRLLLGISGVGAWVVLATAALLMGLPEWLAGLTQGRLAADALAIVGLSFFVALVQAPFDLLGGFILPRRHGRSSERVVAFLWRWLRGAAAYQGTYLLVGVSLLIASRAAGAPGMVLVGIASSVMLLSIRMRVARIIGGMPRPETNHALGDDAAVMASSDVGFSGGIDGVLRARRQLVPRKWIDSLSPETLALALRRRREAVTSGLWFRGRIASLGFVWIGLAIAGSQVKGLVGTAGGVVAFGAAFTLWSFLGLLVLPTLSRRASTAIDAELIVQGVSPTDLKALASILDRMQDDEPTRPRWVEAIFHPIPNVTSRPAEARRPSLAAWDVARTCAFLGLSGLSPLGRAVHCNSGRPSLWAYLPLD